MASTANQTLWGFLYWIKHNRHLSIEAMTEDDLDILAAAYATNNASDGATLTAADPGTYSAGQTYGALADAEGIAAQTPTQATCDQSHYPKTHYSGG